MKRLFINIIVICLFLLNISCSSKIIIESQKKQKEQFKQKREILSNSLYYPEKAESELKRKTLNPCDYPFTLNCDIAYGSPIILYEIDGKVLYAIIDTGSTYSYIYKSGIEKLFGNENNFIKQNILEWYKENYVYNSSDIKIKNASELLIIEKIKKELQKNNLSVQCEGLYYDISNFWGSADICLGQDFLRKYNRVTFDFINNIMTVDATELDGQRIPMISRKSKVCYIYFTYNDKQELGLLDTGNYTFTPRNSIGDGSKPYNLIGSLDNPSFNSDYDGDISLTTDEYLTFDNIKIGDITFNNIKGQYANIPNSGYNKGSQLKLMLINGIGCELFQNHIIQFDFENNEFIVK